MRMSALEEVFLPWLSGKQSGLGGEAELRKSVRCGSYRSRCSQMRKAKQNTADAQSEGSWIQENSAAQHVRRLKEWVLCCYINRLHVFVTPEPTGDTSLMRRPEDEGGVHICLPWELVELLPKPVVEARFDWGSATPSPVAICSLDVDRCAHMFWAEAALMADPGTLWLRLHTPASSFMSRRDAMLPSVTTAHYISSTADSLSRTLGAQQTALLT